MTEVAFPIAAEELARRAFADRVDKAGRPYVGHLERVAAALRGDPFAEAVAWLHDLIEDRPQFETEMRRQQPLVVIGAVVALTRYPGVTPADYYARVRANPLALRVKACDIDDNDDDARLSLLDPETASRLRKKYQAARLALGLKAVKKNSGE